MTNYHQNIQIAMIELLKVVKNLSSPIMGNYHVQFKKLSRVCKRKKEQPVMFLNPLNVNRHNYGHYFMRL